MIALISESRQSQRRLQRWGSRSAHRNGLSVRIGPEAGQNAHGIDNQQDVHQRLLVNLIAAGFEAQAKMLQCATTPYEPSEKVSRELYEKSVAELKFDPGIGVILPSYP